MRTRGSDGPIEFELKYRESPKTPIITYHLAISEEKKGPYVDTESEQIEKFSGVY